MRIQGAIIVLTMIALTVFLAGCIGAANQQEESSTMFTKIGSQVVSSGYTITVYHYDPGNATLFRCGDNIAVIPDYQLNKPKDYNPIDNSIDMVSQ
jgi:hypothetical protein